MLRKIALYFARRKNPGFQLDPAVSGGVLLELAWNRFWCFVRGWKLLLHVRTPPPMFFLGKGVRFFHARNMQFGRFVQIHEHAFLSALGKQKLVIGDNVNIGAYSRLIVSQTYHDVGAYIRIGNNVGLGDFAHLGGAGGLEIGNDCIIGAYLSCHPENHLYHEAGKLIRLQGVSRKGIKVGNNCWIGAKVTILDGVQVGDNCILAAGAVLTKSVPPNSIVGGVPARVIGQVPAGRPATQQVPELTN